MGEEGGEPIYGQAQGFRAKRLPRQLFVDILHRQESKILTLICFGTNIQGRTFCDAIKKGNATADPSGLFELIFSLKSA